MALKTQIVIVDDDETLSKAMVESFNRAGHKAYAFRNENEFISHISDHTTDYLFMDCFLPGRPGIDLVEIARKTNPSNPFKVILMSGIFTDKNFIAESIKKTQAIDFITKPFNVEDLLNIVHPAERTQTNIINDKVFSNVEKKFKVEDDPRKSLYQIFKNSNTTTRQKRKLIESLDDVSGFDLPFIYSLLVETKSSGHLNISYEDGSVSGVTFCDGNIIAVDVDDKATMLGEMLIQSGYASPSDVKLAVREKQKTRLGDYMIQANLISPHAFDIMLAEQMNIRLSRTIVDSSVKVNFSPSETEMSSPFIDSHLLTYYLHDWIVTKVSVDWLKGFYLPYFDKKVILNTTFDASNQILQMAIFKSLSGFVESISQNKTLSELIKLNQRNEDVAYKAIHFLLSKGFIILSESKGELNEQDRLNKLEKIWTEIGEKDSISVIKYLESSSLYTDLDGLSDEFIDLIGPEPESVNLKKIWNRIKEKVIESVAEVMDATQFKQSEAEKKKSLAESKIKANSLIEEAKQALIMNQVHKAETLLKQVKALNVEADQFHIVSSWVKILRFDITKTKDDLKDIELTLIQIPPEQKYDFLYAYVLAMVNKLKSEFEEAKKNLEKCIALNPGFLPARRELSSIASKLRPVKQENILTGDLKTIVSGFFKKK